MTRHGNAFPRCGVDQPTALRAELCRMPRRNVRVYVDPTNAPFDVGATQAAILAGAKMWSGITELRFELADDRGSSHIALDFRVIDRPGNVLAWSQFPCPFNPPVRQRYDTREKWSNTAPPAPGRISLVITACHEVGHALGIRHGPGGNIMAPTISPDVNTLGPWDREQALLRYAAAPPNDGGDPVNDLFKCLIQALPGFLNCLFSGQEAAEKENREGPIDALAKLTNAALERTSPNQE